MNNKKRLLICAPSNAAIDEIAHRLLKGIAGLNGSVYVPNIVRIGSSSIHEDIKRITLEVLVQESQQSLKDFGTSKSDLKSISHGDMQAQLSVLNLEKERLATLMTTDLNPGDTKTAKEDLSIINVKIYNTLKLKELRKSETAKMNKSIEDAKRKIRDKIISDADIIMCTLSGSGQDVVSSVKGVEFQTVFAFLKKDNY